MHAILAMHSSIEQDNWASLLPMVQLVNNTSFSATMHETPLFLMFCRQARLPVDIMLGIPHVGSTADTAVFAQNIRDNLQIALALTRRDLAERATKQAADNDNLRRFLHSNLDRRYWYSDPSRILMVQTRNHLHRGEDLLLSSSNSLPLSVE